MDFAGHNDNVLDFLRGQRFLRPMAQHAATLARLHHLDNMGHLPRIPNGGGASTAPEPQPDEVA